MFSFYTELEKNQESWCIELISPALGLVFSLLPCLRSPGRQILEGETKKPERLGAAVRPAYLLPSSMPVRLDNGHRQEIEDGKVIQKYARGSEILTPTRHFAFWAILPGKTMLTVSANKTVG